MVIKYEDVQLNNKQIDMTSIFNRKKQRSNLIKINYILILKQKFLFEIFYFILIYLFII
jgi:hypothetical protein